MDDKIKFRAWEEEFKCMHFTSGCSHKFIFDGDGFYGLELPEQNDQYDIFIPANKLILMQFTGLFDKDVKEIYAGDIVRNYEEMTMMCNSNVKTGQFTEDIGIVEFDPDRLCWNKKIIKSECIVIGSSIRIEPKIFSKYNKRIGNIYENPELIKEQ